MRDQLTGLAVTALAWLACVAFGAMLAWCLFYPDYEPISEAEWEATLLEQGVGQ